MNFYISDMHFYHENVLAFDRRPFADVAAMNEAIFANWNSRVGEEDTVYVLGDAFWRHEEESCRMLQQLKGHKHLIIGNHDRLKGRLLPLWESTAPYAEILDSNIQVVLCHYPILFFRNQHRNAVMLYGHVHNSREWHLVEKWKQEQRSLGIPCRLINVGCMMEYMGYTPRTLAELLAADADAAGAPVQTAAAGTGAALPGDTAAEPSPEGPPEAAT